MAYNAHRDMIRSSFSSFIPHVFAHFVPYCLPFSNLDTPFHGSFCQEHLPPLGFFTLILPQRCNSSILSPWKSSWPHLCHLAWLSCLCSHRAFTSSIGAFIILCDNVFSPLLYCEILEGKSSLSYLKPQEQAQCLVYNTLNKC